MEEFAGDGTGRAHEKNPYRKIKPSPNLL